MANEWYVQHAGKQYGPLTSANLKKLATEGKITPTTTVRLGSEGNWVPASRVQGLFAAARPAEPSSMPPSAPAKSGQPKADAPPRAARAVAPPAAKVAAPPVAPPPAPPLAKPLATSPLRSLSSQRNAAPVGSGSMAPKILGAVALVLGTLALATFWLPIAGQVGAMGWTGIVVGSLGLFLGIGGFVLSAVQNGSGLYLNIAGTASSIVGLVLTVIFGVMFGLFASAPPRRIVVQLPPPVQAPPEPETPPAAEPEPEAPPEPVWTIASESIEQGPIKASIASVAIEQVRLESADLSTLKRQPPKPMLKVKVKIENTTADKIVEVPGWIGGNDLIPQGVGQLLEGSELGKAVQSATPVAKLNDNVGNPYKQESMLSIFGARISNDNALRPGKGVEKELVFPPPLETIEYLRLELPPAGFGGSEPLRFEIPKAMVGGL